MTRIAATTIVVATTSCRPLRVIVGLVEVRVSRRARASSADGRVSRSPSARGCWFLTCRSRFSSFTGTSQTGHFFVAMTVSRLARRVLSGIKILLLRGRGRHDRGSRMAPEFGPSFGFRDEPSTAAAGALAGSAAVCADGIRAPAGPSAILADLPTLTVRTETFVRDCLRDSKQRSLPSCDHIAIQGQQAKVRAKGTALHEDRLGDVRVLRRDDQRSFEQARMQGSVDIVRDNLASQRRPLLCGFLRGEARDSAGQLQAVRKRSRALIDNDARESSDDGVVRHPDVLMAFPRLERTAMSISTVSPSEARRGSAEKGVGTQVFSPSCVQVHCRLFKEK